MISYRLRSFLSFALSLSHVYLNFLRNFFYFPLSLSLFLFIPLRFQQRKWWKNLSSHYTAAQILSADRRAKPASFIGLSLSLSLSLSFSLSPSNNLSLYRSFFPVSFSSFLSFSLSFPPSNNVSLYYSFFLVYCISLYYIYFLFFSWYSFLFFISLSLSFSSFRYIPIF